MFHRLLNRIDSLVRRRRTDEELDDEIRTHLEMACEEYVSLGMSRGRAMRAARRDFGRVERAREGHRDVRGLPSLENLARDVRLALRRIRRGPGFAVVAILSLALGVGANAAIFNAATALVLRPIPGAGDPNRIVEIVQTDAREGDFSSMAYPDFVDLRDQVPAFAS